MFATDSGIKVHRAINTFLSTGEVDLEEKHFPYFRNIYEQLEVLEPPDIIWNEGPPSRTPAFASRRVQLCLGPQRSIQDLLHH